MNNRIRTRLVIGFTVAVLLIGGGTGTATAGSQANPGKKGAVLAEINGAVIIEDELLAELEKLPEQFGAKAKTAQGRKDLFDSLVIRELILQQAGKDGLDRSPEVVARLEEIRKRLIVETYLKKRVEAEARVTDAELKRYYDQNREKFQHKEQVRASHILLKTEKEAKTILAQLRSGGNFDELARKSACRDTADKGGDLGWFAKGVMVPEFEKATLALKIGAYSDVVKTAFGYHIIKLTDRRPAGVRPFSESQEEIRSTLIPAKQQEVFTNIRETLRKGANITIMDEAFADDES